MSAGSHIKKNSTNHESICRYALFPCTTKSHDGATLCHGLAGDRHARLSLKRMDDLPPDDVQAARTNHSRPPVPLRGRMPAG